MLRPGTEGSTEVPVSQGVDLDRGSSHGHLQPAFREVWRSGPIFVTHQTPGSLCHGPSVHRGSSPEVFGTDPGVDRERHRDRVVIDPERMSCLYPNGRPVGLSSPRSRVRPFLGMGRTRVLDRVPVGSWSCSVHSTGLCVGHRRRLPDPGIKDSWRVPDRRRDRGRCLPGSHRGDPPVRWVYVVPSGDTGVVRDKESLSSDRQATRSSVFESLVYSRTGHVG